MMRKERELLKECRLILDTPFNGSTGINLRNRITELLAQPEQDLKYDLPSWENGYAAGRSAENERLLAQPEQAPDYYLWFDEVHEEHPTNEGDDDVIPLYTSPPKREPLSGEERYVMYIASRATSIDAYMTGFRDAEKAHGIGVDDE